MIAAQNRTPKVASRSATVYEKGLIIDEGSSPDLTRYWYARLPVDEWLLMDPEARSRYLWYPGIMASLTFGGIPIAAVLFVFMLMQGAGVPAVGFLHGFPLTIERFLWAALFGLLPSMPIAWGIAKSRYSPFGLWVVRRWKEPTTGDNPPTYRIEPVVPPAQLQDYLGDTDDPLRVFVIRGPWMRGVIRQDAVRHRYRVKNPRLQKAQMQSLAIILVSVIAILFITMIISGGAS